MSPVESRIPVGGNKGICRHVTEEAKEAGLDWISYANQQGFHFGHRFQERTYREWKALGCAHNQLLLDKHGRPCVWLGPGEDRDGFYSKPYCAECLREHLAALDETEEGT